MTLFDVIAATPWWQYAILLVVYCVYVFVSKFVDEAYKFFRSRRDGRITVTVQTQPRNADT